MKNFILNIKNVDLIKEASIKINGLTIITGENDTGKNTIGKFLFNEVREYLLNNKTENITSDNKILHSPIFIKTLDTLDKFNCIKNTSVILPTEIIDLFLRIPQPNTKSKNITLFQNIKQIINGEVYYDKLKDDIFYKKDNVNINFEMNKTSNGIKMFGIFQLLLLNENLKKDTILILIEPEAHLHPKWQIKYAKFIIELVQNGVKVLVTSHSPYMIDAFELYSQKNNITANFYISDKKGKHSIIKDVSDDLEPIYKQLAEPINELEDLSVELKK